MFKEGDYIHYGSAGLSRIEELTMMKMSETGEQRLYYRLTPVKGRGSVIYTPVDNQKVKMRRVLTVDEAKALIDGWPHVQSIPLPAGKHTEDACKDALNSLDCYTWASLIKALSERRDARIAAGRKVTSTQERYMREAKDRLYTELAYVLHMTETEVDQLIENSMHSAVC